jgi:hypothetical protein
MRTFTCFMTDRRYTVPTLSIILARDAQRALEIARRELGASRDHVALEVHENGRCVFTEQKTTAQTAAA